MDFTKLKIIKVYDKITKDIIPIENFSIKKYLSPSSNTKQEVLRIFNNENVIKKNNSLMVEYECFSCNRINIVCLNNITRKINKGIVFCNTCKNQEETKCVNQSVYMIKNAHDISNGVIIKENTNIISVKLLDKIKDDIDKFNEMDDDFKDNYFRKHLTLEEFNYIKPKIVSFQGTKFTNLDLFTYYPCIKINNQTQFNPYMYDKVRDVLEKIIYITIKCDNCQELFCNRDLYIQKNRTKVLCQSCNFTNNTFKIRCIKNCNEDMIKYQSKFEKKLIIFCNNNNIIITNGQYIPYKFQDKIKIYRVDFKIQKLGLLIECKDNHCWHKKNLESGQWAAKEKAVKEYILNNKEYVDFKIIFPYDFVKITNNIKILTDKI